MARTVKRPILTDISHGVGGYRKGCGCSVCRSAKSAQRNREIQKAAQRKAAEARGDKPAAAPADPAPAGESLPAADPAAARRPGPVELALIEDLQQVDGIAMQNSLHQVALALAREIDENAGASVAGAARQLVATLIEIRKATSANDDELAKFMAGFGSPIRS